MIALGPGRRLPGRQSLHGAVRSSRSIGSITPSEDRRVKSAVRTWSGLVDCHSGGWVRSVVFGILPRSSRGRPANPAGLAHRWVRSRVFRDVDAGVRHGPVRDTQHILYILTTLTLGSFDQFSCSDRVRRPGVPSSDDGRRTSRRDRPRRGESLMIDHRRSWRDRVLIRARFSRRDRVGWSAIDHGARTAGASGQSGERSGATVAVGLAPRDGRSPAWFRTANLIPSRGRRRAGRMTRTSHGCRLALSADRSRAFWRRREGRVLVYDGANRGRYASRLT
jgi:hypothetical protein